VKTYTAKDDKITKQDGFMEKSYEIGKTITTLSGDADLKWLHGTRLWVDPSGIVIKGPDLFIGRTYEDLKNLNYNDVFTVERSVMRAMGTTNKSYNADDPDEEILRKSILDEAKVWLDKTLKMRVEERATAYDKDPLYRIRI
jgi:hypothetical protein